MDRLPKNLPYNFCQLKKQITKESKLFIMKSLVLLAFLSLCILPTLSSQNLNVGIKGGLNLYNIYNDNGAKYDNLTGFHVGLLGHIHLTRHLALQPEVVYSAQGAKYDFLGETVSVKLGYINVPLLIQYMFDNGFRMAVGPQIGFLLNAKTETNDNDIDIKSNLKSTDLGVAMGLGYIIPKTGLGVDARYNLGLSNINENESINSMNRGFQFGVLYQFSHK